ncbi:hypothetical protein AMR41_04350 [Hapalosiphon sp. MRB220]|nr:hypothetical protein AMR41_04350 [Hapalosiphon sp. MRB220]
MIFEHTKTIFEHTKTIFEHTKTIFEHTKTIFEHTKTNIYLGLTQKTSQTLIPLCTLRLCGLFFSDQHLQHFVG